MDEQDNELDDFEKMDVMRQRAIEYLLKQRTEDKRPFEFTASELSDVLGIDGASVYAHMETLVKKGEWGKRYAYDPELHRPVRVWWMKETGETSG